MLALLAAATLAQLPGSPPAPLKEIRIEFQFLVFDRPVDWKAMPGASIKIENPPAHTPILVKIVNGANGAFARAISEREDRVGEESGFKSISSPILRSFIGAPGHIAQKAADGEGHAVHVATMLNEKNPSMIDLSVSFSPTFRENQDSTPWPFTYTATISLSQMLVFGFNPPVEKEDLKTKFQALTIRVVPGHENKR